MISPLVLAKKFGTPVYAYDADIIRAKCRELKRHLPGTQLQYACKANTNLAIVKLIVKEGFGVETVSPREIKVARQAGTPVSRITYTCASVSESELVLAARQGVRIHLDSLHQVEIFAGHFPGGRISVRLNQGIGAGHHSHVVTGGPNSKFGIDVAQISQLQKLARKYKLRVVGLHQHIGSNVLDASVLLRAIDVLLKTARHFPDLEHLDFGGGLGVPYKPQEQPLNIAKLGKDVIKKISSLTNHSGKHIKVSFEPGRYLVAEAGFLITTVMDVKRNPKKTFIGVDSGMNHLIRPALYGSYHEIVNASRPVAGRKKEKITIVGNICESGDILAEDRLMALPVIGDVLVIKNAGAYGYAMSSDYNLRPRPTEVLAVKNKAKKI